MADGLRLNVAKTCHAHVHQAPRLGIYIGLVPCMYIGLVPWHMYIGLVPWHIYWVGALRLSPCILAATAVRFVPSQSKLFAILCLRCCFAVVAMVVSRVEMVATAGPRARPAILARQRRCAARESWLARRWKVPATVATGKPPIQSFENAKEVRFMFAGLRCTGVAAANEPNMPRQKIDAEMWAVSRPAPGSQHEIVGHGA